MTTRSERRRILEKLAAGCITPEHADELLEREGAGSTIPSRERPGGGTAWQLSLDPVVGRSRPARHGGSREERGGR
jgi:hypothetical protein